MIILQFFRISPKSAGTYKKGKNQVTITMNSSVQKGQVSLYLPNAEWEVMKYYDTSNEDCLPKP